MATETLYADGNVTVSAGCTDVANALGAPDGIYTTNGDDLTNWTERFTIGDPTDPLTPGHTGHTVTVTCRKNSAGGNGDPTLAVDLYGNGTLVRSLQAATAVTDSTTTFGPFTFTTAEVSGGSSVEVLLDVVGQGGSPAGRRNVQVDAITVAVDTAVAAEAHTGTADFSGASLFAASGAPGFTRTVSRTGSGDLDAAGETAGRDVSDWSDYAYATTWVLGEADPLFGSGQLAADEVPGFAGAVSHSGTGVLVSEGAVVASDDVALDGAGSLSAVGLSVIAGAADYIGDGTLELGPFLPPQAVTAPAITQSQIDLVWSMVAGASRYDLERNGVVIATGLTESSYSDTELSPSTEYTYRVRSVR